MKPWMPGTPFSAAEREREAVATRERLRQGVRHATFRRKYARYLKPVDPKAAELSRRIVGERPED